MSFKTTECDGGGHVVSCASGVASERAVRHERVFRDRSNHLYVEYCIISRHFRFPREEKLILSDLLRANLEKPTHHSQAVPVEVLVVLL